MRLSRERVIFIGILAIALCGLLLDRWLGGSGPRSADAAMLLAQPDLLIQPSRSAETDPTLTPLAIDPSGLCRQLQTLRQKLAAESAVRDAFLAEWGSVSPMQAGASSVVASPVFLDYRLTAVLAQEGRGYAVINGQIVGVGQSVGGHRLIGLTQRSAILQTPQGQELVLTLADESFGLTSPSR